MTQWKALFEQGLNPLRGYSTSHNCLMKAAPLAAALRSAGTTVPAGRVVVLDDNGEFVVDRANATSLTAKKTAVPMYLVTSSDDPDVENDGTSPLSGNIQWHSIIPGEAANLGALVSLGGYELQSTEFDTAQTYLPNQPLTSDANGKLTNQGAVVGTNWICGYCSWFEEATGAYDEFGLDSSGTKTARGTSPVGKLANGLTVLTFWTDFYPIPG